MASLPSLLVALLTILSFTLAIGGVWVAVWAWRTFRVTAFAWVVMERLVSAVWNIIQTDQPRPDRVEADKAIAKFAEMIDLSPGSAVVSVLYSTSLCSHLSLLALFLIAVTELTHIGPKLVEGFAEPRFFRVCYRLRWLLGTTAVVMPLVPSLLLQHWMNANGLAPAR